MIPTRRYSFRNRDQYALLPFAVMAPATESSSAVEVDEGSGVLRLARVSAVHASAQDAGLCFVNGPQAVPTDSAGSCTQGQIVQALIRQDTTDGIDHAALIVPDALIGPATDSQGLAAGGTAFRFLGFEGCPLLELKDVRQPKHRLRVGWVTPSYSPACRFFKAEERRRQYVYPYAGVGLVTESNRASLAGGATRPIVSGFDYRAFDTKIDAESSPDFSRVKWGSPELPASAEGDAVTPIEYGAKGTAQLRCRVGGVYQIGFTASVKPVEAGSDVRGMTLGLLVERSAYKYSSSDDLADDESGIFLAAYQEGVYVRPENWAWAEEIDSYFVTVSGTTIIDAKAGDRFHVVNAATGVLEVRYLNCWAMSLAADQSAFG